MVLQDIKNYIINIISNNDETPIKVKKIRQFFMDHGFSKKITNRTDVILNSLD